MTHHRRVRVGRAESAAELREVDQLRRSVFVGELGYCPESGERERGVLLEANRQGALLLARFDGEPAGTIAVDWWRGLDVDHADVRHYRMRPFAEAFGAHSLLTARKWVGKPAYRSARVGFALVRAVAAFTAARADAHFVIMDCVPARVRAYQALGFRRYTEPFCYEADGALSIPLCLVASDLEYLRDHGPTAYRFLAEEGQHHRPDVAVFFESLAGPPRPTRRRPSSEVSAVVRPGLRH